MVLVLSDDHGRYLNNLISSELDNNFSVQSVIKPGAPFVEVINNANRLAKDFGANDTVIIVAGANDIEATSNSNSIINNAVAALTPLSNKTNLILTTIPDRHDKPELNIRVKAFNSLLVSSVDKSNMNKCMLAFNFETERLKRFHFNLNGKYMNRLGKKQVSMRFAQLIKNQTNFSQERKIKMPDIRKKTHLTPNVNFAQCKTYVNITNALGKKQTFLDRWLKRSQDKPFLCQIQTGRPSG